MMVSVNYYNCAVVFLIFLLTTCTKGFHLGHTSLSTTEQSERNRSGFRQQVSVEPPNAERYREPWEINYNVCPPSLCTANEQQMPRGTGRSVFYNGDIVLDKELEKVIYSNSSRPRYKRATTRNYRTWKNAIVPYMFASDIAPKSASVLGEAMRTIEKETCIRFRRRKFRDEDYIRYISEPGCWSAIGRVGGEQKVSLGFGCERIGIAIHEILHALGCWHEQARPDRDRYVEIMEENILPKYIPDFKKINTILVTSRGFPYDYQSVMHYGNKAFTNLGKDTIKVIGIGRMLNMSIGQRDALSNIDIAQLRDMYKCYTKDNFNTYCQKDWVKFSQTCYKFEDKQIEQFSGAVKKCNDMNSELLSINDLTEESNIRSYIKKVYPKIKVWRTGERIPNGTFLWYTGKSQEEMKYTNWEKSRPATYSSLAQVYSKKNNRVRWQGVWLGSYYPYAFICERRARRKCIPGNFLDGRDYRGTLDRTVDGFTCQKWSSQYPWSHKLLLHDGKDNKQDGLGDHNYCRNPSRDRKRRPWCYTTKSDYKWQYCDVSICLKDEENGSYNKSYQNSNQRRDTIKGNYLVPRITNKRKHVTINRTELKHVDGTAIFTKNLKSNSEMRKYKMSKMSLSNTGKIGSSSRNGICDRKERNGARNRYTPNRKNGKRNRSRRTSKSKRMSRRRKSQSRLSSRQNKI